MDGGQSISFTSFDSYNYPSHNNLTFHEIQPFNSQYDLAKDSMIRNFPGKKVNLGEHLEILVLLQTAEIERLTKSLHEYRMKFKRIMNNEKDFHSFKNQANELLQVKDELEFTNKKIYQYAENQKGELMDQVKYVHLLESKYKRALKLIEEAHLSNQQAEHVISQQKDELIVMERTFQSFKQRSIEQYQALRDELERGKSQELSFQVKKLSEQKQRWSEICAREQSKYKAERQKYQVIIEQQHNKLTVANNEIERLKQELDQNRTYAEKINQNYKVVEVERENHYAMLGTEIQRLNFLLKEKSTQMKELENKIQELNTKLNQKTEEGEWLKRQAQRHRNKNTFYEQEFNKQNGEITKLSTNVSSLTTKINEMGLMINEKEVQLKLKDNKLNKQIENYSQILSKSEFVFNKEIQESRVASINTAKELQRLRKEGALKQDNFNKKVAQFQTKIKEMDTQKSELNASLNKQTLKYKQLQEKYKLQNNKLIKDIQALRKKIEESYLQKRNLQLTFRKEQKQFMQSSNKNYEERWEELNQRYIQSNQKIKSLMQSKQNQEKSIYNLKNLLEKSESQKDEIIKCRTFESMIKEIESLCESTMKKDGEISQLKNVILNLEKETKEVKGQLQSLRQATIKLININNANESSRRQDNYLMIEQIKKLFIQHSIIIEEVKENTHKIAFNYNRHKEFMESSQDHLVKSKEFEIADLKEKLSMSEKQTQSKNELKEIINKIIVITKENTELKVTSNKKHLEIEHLTKQIEDLKRDLNRNNENTKVNIKEKDQMCKKLFSQLEESNSLLFEQKQNQMKLQSTLIGLEQQKDRISKEVASKDSIIKQLRTFIKTKDELSSKLTSTLEELERRHERLQDELRDLKEQKHNLETITKEKDEHIKQLKQIYDKNEQNSKGRYLQIEKSKQEVITKLNEVSQQSNLHISKLKNQVNVLISENSDLREQMIRTGSTIIALSQQNQSLKSFEFRYKNQAAECQSYKQQINELLQSLNEQQIIKYQYENIKMEYEYLKQELQKNQKMSLSHSQRMQILEKQIQKLEAIINDYKIKNSQLENNSYDQSLIIQRNKVSQQKIIILSEEIDRLQKDRMNLIEQLNICRIQMSQDCTLDRQAKQHHVLFVLLFIEIQSLRQLLHKKEQQFTQLRRTALK